MTTPLQLKPSLLMTEKDGKLFVLDKSNGRVHEFNHTGKVIFQLFLEPRTQADAAVEFARYFGISQSQALSDVVSILDLCRANDLLLPGIEVP